MGISLGLFVFTYGYLYIPNGDLTELRGLPL